MLGFSRILFIWICYNIFAPLQAQNTPPPLGPCAHFFEKEQVIQLASILSESEISTLSRNETYRDRVFVVTAAIHFLRVAPVSLFEGLRNILEYPVDREHIGQIQLSLFGDSIDDADLYKARHKTVSELAAPLGVRAEILEVIGVLLSKYPIVPKSVLAHSEQARIRLLAFVKDKVPSHVKLRLIQESFKRRRDEIIKGFKVRHGREPKRTEIKRIIQRSIKSASTREKNLETANTMGKVLKAFGRYCDDAKGTMDGNIISSIQFVRAQIRPFLNENVEDISLHYLYKELFNYVIYNGIPEYTAEGIRSEMVSDLRFYLKDLLREFKREEEAKLIAERQAAATETPDKPQVPYIESTSRSITPARTQQSKRRRKQTQGAKANGTPKPKQPLKDGIHRNKKLELFASGDRDLSELQANTTYRFVFKKDDPKHRGLQTVIILPKALESIQANGNSDIQGRKWLETLILGYVRGKGENGVSKLLRLGNKRELWEIKILSTTRRMLMSKNEQGHWVLEETFSK